MLNGALSVRSCVFLWDILIATMRNKTIRLIIGLMTLALLGVMAMQYYFIRQSYIQQSQLFDESVKAAISSVAARAERKEVMEYSLSIQKKSKERYERELSLEEQLRIQEEIEQVRAKLIDKQQDYRMHEDNMYRLYPHAVYIDNEFYETYINNSQNNHLVSIDFGVQRTGMGSNLYQENFIEVKALKALPLAKAQDDSVRFLLLMDINPMTKIAVNNIIALPPKTDLLLERRLKSLEQNLRLLQANTLVDSIAILGGKNPRVVEDFAISVELSKRPLNDRVDVVYLQQELKEELSLREINSPFHLEVKDDQQVLYTFANSDLNIDHTTESYSTPLFREDLDRSPGQLTIYFPNKNKVLLENVSMMLFSSIALLLVLVGSFAYTILTILRQKKISEMKTDFINNMTHEFKTPVATIMIASESLKDPDITMDEQRVAKLANIIYDENVRLGNHIERVLNIAQLEKENLRLHLREIPVNKLVAVVADSMELQFQKNGVEVGLNLEAESDLIIGDELHLSNVIYNLLDNALKYGKENPKINISTKNVSQGIRISVEDNGIGMNKDQLSKIFDQFYRIPTGNLHDVKGFGLGLSYVSEIVKSLHGKVIVKSEKGKGTIFEVYFPLKKEVN